MAGENGPQTADGLARGACEAVQQGRLSEAEELLLRAIELAPEDPRYPAAFATVFLRGSRHSLAAVYAQLAAMLAPTEDRYQRVLGAIWEAAGDGAWHARHISMPPGSIAPTNVPGWLWPGWSGRRGATGQRSHLPAGQSR